MSGGIGYSFDDVYGEDNGEKQGHGQGKAGQVLFAREKMSVAQFFEAGIGDDEIKKYIREDIINRPLDEKAFKGSFLELFRWLRLKFQFHMEVVMSAMAFSFIFAASTLGRKSSLDKNIKSI